jgi:hypothetical protein
MSYYTNLNLQDLKKKPKYLVTFTVGINQKKNIDAAVKKVLKCVIHCISFFIDLIFYNTEASSYILVVL